MQPITGGSAFGKSAWQLVVHPTSCHMPRSHACRSRAPSPLRPENGVTAARHFARPRRRAMLAAFQTNFRSRNAGLMAHYVDLHAHYLPALDDGATDRQMSLQMVRAIAALGFSDLYATPHQREGMFMPARAAIDAAFRRPRRTRPPRASARRSGSAPRTSGTRSCTTAAPARRPLVRRAAPRSCSRSARR